jgi:hypothetical protein
LTLKTAPNGLGSLPIVKHLDELEHRHPSPIHVPVHLFCFERREKLSTTALSQQFPLRLMLKIAFASERVLWYAQLVYWLPSQNDAADQARVCAW